jgi:polar amino acid transport system substrate-binding protein
MKAITFCLVLSSTLAGAANAGEKVVIYGDDAYPPYSYLVDGKLKGIYVDIVNKAGAQLAPTYEVVLEPIPWKRGLASLESGEGFALFPPYLRKERTWIDPYSVPFYHESVVLFCNEKVMETPRKNFPDDFSGLSIGVNAGFIMAPALTEALAAGKVTLAETKGNDANLKKLAAQRIGCYASDRNAALFTAKSLVAEPGMADLKLIEATELSTGEDVYIGYSGKSTAPYKADFVEKMNAALEQVKSSGAVTEISNSYK